MAFLAAHADLGAFVSDDLVVAVWAAEVGLFAEVAELLLALGTGDSRINAT